MMRESANRRIGKSAQGPPASVGPQMRGFADSRIRRFTPIPTRTLAAVLLLGAAACASQPDASPARRAEVAARGARVMPFDLSKTSHVFQDLPDGGLQTVTANDPADTLQLRLIRSHLREEAEKFSRGDFDDPMAIHGHAMPGVAELRQGFRRFAVRFDSIAAGATLRYTSNDSALVQVLHRWFAAQRADHGGGADGQGGGGAEGQQ